MKKNLIIPITLLSVGVFLPGCTDLTAELAEKKIVDLVSYPSPTAEDNIDESLFAHINLDYPGLERVKAQYEQKQYYYAACELLTYYRNRGHVQNPNIDLLTPTISENEQNIADQALERRFYIRNFKEGVSNGKEVYYSFDQNGKIDWETKANSMSDQEFRNQLHRHQWMPAQAKAYRVTGNEKYFNSWKSTYTDWMNTYPIPEGKVDAKNVPWHNLQPTERVRDRLNILPYFIQSTNFTPGWLATVLKATAQEVDVIRNGYDNEGSNIRLTQDKVVATAGILLPEMKKAEEWRTEGLDLVTKELATQFNEDGVHNQLDPSYHIAAISDFNDMYHIAKVNGYEDKLPTDYFNRLNKAAHFVADIIFPNYTIDNYNDTRNSSYTKSVLLKNLKRYAEIFPNDETLQWLATERRQGKAPDKLMSKYEVSGYYMLRNGWDENSTMMVLKNNNNAKNEWHCQPDNGTFSLYRKGRNFFPDAGVYSYGVSGESYRQRQKYRATKLHNTLTVDELTIDGNHMNGKFRSMYTEGNNQVLVTENLSYTDLTHRRSVIFVDKKFFVIIDEAYGKPLDKSINLHFHLQTDNNKANVVMDDQSQDHIYGAHTAFSDNNNIFMRTFAETHEGFKVTNVESKISNKLTEENGLRMGYTYTIRHPAGGVARFITVICPSDGATLPTVNARFSDNAPVSATALKDQGAGVVVTIDGKEYPLTIKL